MIKILVITTSSYRIVQYKNKDRIKSTKNNVKSKLKNECG